MRSLRGRIWTDDENSFFCFLLRFLRLICRGRCPHRPLRKSRIRRRFPLKTARSAGGQSRPPLRNTENRKTCCRGRRLCRPNRCYEFAEDFWKIVHSAWANAMPAGWFRGATALCAALRAQGGALGTGRTVIRRRSSRRGRGGCPTGCRSVRRRASATARRCGSG